MDFIERGISDRYGLRFIFVDVSRTAHTLAERHHCGLPAAEVLAQALVGAGLLSSDLENEDEAISIQMKVNGPVGGLMVEAVYGGLLRGYTYRKTLEFLDNQEITDLSEVLGTSGQMAVHHSKPGTLLYSGYVPAAPPDMERNLARFYNMSRQVPTGVSLFTSRMDRGGGRAQGIVAQKLPYADTEKFVAVLERFNDGRLREGFPLEAGLNEAARILELPDLMVVSRSDLGFGCRCSYIKIINALSGFPGEELQEMIASLEPQIVTCHFCGQVYSVSRGELARILEERTG